MYLKDVMTEYSFDCRIRKLSPKTIENYMKQLRYFQRYLEDTYGISHVEEIKRTHIKHFLSMMDDKNRKPQYINDLLKVIKTFFRYAVREGHVMLNPTEGVKNVKQPKVKIITFTEMEIRRLLNYYHGRGYLDTRNRTILALFFDTGMRLNEVLTLCADQIYDDHTLRRRNALFCVPFSVGCGGGGLRMDELEKCGSRVALSRLILHLRGMKLHLLYVKLPMSKSEGQKMKLFALKEILEQETDANHGITMARTIHSAIAKNAQISFQYFDYDLKKQRRYFKKGERYTASPWAMIYTDDNYYLLAYEGGKFKHFRVDKMEDVQELTTQIGVVIEREGAEAFENVDMSAYSKYTFSMFGGEITPVTMVFQNRMMGAVMDRFGRDVVVMKEDDRHFRITVPVAVSNQFYGWVFGLGKSVRIIGPDSVKEGMKKALADITARYE